MITKQLKCGKNLSFPSMFVNLQNPMEAKVFKLLNERYPLDARHCGVSFIDGVVFSLKDYERILRSMTQRDLYEFSKNGTNAFSDKVSVIDPGIHLLFQGTLEEKKDMLDTGLFPESIADALGKMTYEAKPSQKTVFSIDNIYPLLDALVIRNLIEYQINHQQEIVVSPSVPITTSMSSKFEKQLSKVSEMNRASRVLFDTVFKRAEYNELMNLLTINVSVINPENIDLLANAVIASRPDHIGLRPVNFTEADIPRIGMLLQLVQRIAQRTEGKIPIHMFNVTEFGYVAFCHGATSFVTPMATDPYFKRKNDENPPPRKGAFYHPKDMIHYPYRLLLDKTRQMAYRLPCHCEICERYINIPRVPDPYWNEFRRIHFLLIKSMEMKELRDAKDSLRTAVRDKFARSERTTWLSFLD